MANIRSVGQLPLLQALAGIPLRWLRCRAAGGQRESGSVPGQMHGFRGLQGAQLRGRRARAARPDRQVLPESSHPLCRL